MSDDIRYTSPEEKAAELADAADVFLSYKDKTAVSVEWIADKVRKGVQKADLERAEKFLSKMVRGEKKAPGMGPWRKYRHARYAAEENIGPKRLARRNQLRNAEEEAKYLKELAREKRNKRIALGVGAAGLTTVGAGLALKGRGKEKKAAIPVVGPVIGALLGADIALNRDPDSDKKLQRALIGAGIGAGAGFAGSKFLDIITDSAMRNAQRQRAQYLNAMGNKLDDLKRRAQELADATSPYSVPPKPPTALEKAKAKGWDVFEGGKKPPKEKKAFLAPVRSGLKGIGGYLGKHPRVAESVVSGAGWGTAGAIGGGLFPGQEGSRTKSMLKGFAAGAAGGAVAPHAGRAAKKWMSPAATAAVKTASPIVPPDDLMYEFQVRANRKFTPKRVPSFTQEVKNLLEEVKDQATGIHKAKTTLPATGFSKAAVNQQAAKTMVKRFLPEAFTDPRALPFVVGGAGLLGTSTYLGSRPKKSLGGKSKSQIQTEETLRALQATPPRKSDKLKRKLDRRIAEFRSGVADDFAEHPVAGGLLAASLGAVTGAGIGTSVARVLKGRR